MPIPEDLRKAANLLNEASTIIAARLANDQGPKTPTQRRALAAAIVEAQEARALLATADDEAARLTHADVLFAD